MAVFLALVPSAPAVARAPVRSALADYVRARVADSDGDSATALAGYHAASKSFPNDAVLASRLFRQAIMQGDMPRTLETARKLDAQNRLPADARFLLIVDAINHHDDSLAKSHAARLEQESVFGFTGPILRAWLAFGAHEADPFAQLNGPAVDPSFASYYDEHRCLLLLASGKANEGVAMARNLIGSSGEGRAIRLQMLAATALAQAGKRNEALEILAGDDPTLVAARQRLNTGQSFVRPVTTATQGIADLLLRLASDVNRERVTPMALTIARAALLANPTLTESRMFTSGLLAASDQPRLGLTLLPDEAHDVYGATIAILRIQLLEKAGDTVQAVVVAERLARAPDASDEDWTRLADLYSDVGRYQDASDAFQRAIALVEAKSGKDAVPWSYRLLFGGALEKSGDWHAAKAELTEAVRLGPDQPVALNYLGYAQLARRENLEEAEKLIERAATLRPDDPAITDSLGWTYFVRGQHQKAIDTLERAVIAEPAEPTINEHLGDAYWQVGRKIDARYAWNAALVHAEPAEAERLRTKIDRGLTPETTSP
ncbi:tetratricopeptide repeat protein [Aquisediminimonas sediminicola]|uniref:tetratricopeptide repeat protein n=1 Tax=Alteraquisediminimonas sediminicola TaxID=2676787 RepID=UPI001C8DEC43|nr:tetratricopeptide repeat protein [Aquisediminimonas sediminicola]